MSGAVRPRKPQIPFSLLTGPLGAGKTTLLNRLLKHDRFAGTAAIVNEAGATEVEGAVVERAEEGIISLSGGCVCCTVRGELVEALERLLRAADNGRIAELRRVVIETAGLADPAPILYLVARHPYLSLRFRLDGIVAVLDARTAAAALDAHEETRRQVAFADRIVLTRSDAEADTGALTARLGRLNPGAAILYAREADALPPALAGLFDLPAEDGALRRWLALDAFDAAGRAAPHEPGFSAFALARDGAMSGGSVYDFLDRLTLEHGSKLVRFKGLIALVDDPDRPALVHGIAGLFSSPATLPHWPDAGRLTRLAVVGHGLDRPAVERLLDAFLGGATDTPDRNAILANPLAIPGFRAR